jgi:NAD(P)H dehydrogenase (quinone)
LTAALQGVDKLLLISSSEVGQRAPAPNVINAAKAAGVKFIAYTSLLHADNSRWACTLNILPPKKRWPAPASLCPAAQRLVYRKLSGQRAACAGTWRVYRCGRRRQNRLRHPRRLCRRRRARYRRRGPCGQVYELAGDNGWTLSELAAELSKQSGKNVVYQNLSEADFAAALKASACLPGWRYAGGLRCRRVQRRLLTIAAP